MKAAFRFSVILIAASLGGCVHDEANRYYSSVKYPERQISEVEMLRSPPSRSYEVLADFQSRNETPGDMLAKAAKIGADAVIVVPLGGWHSESDHWAGQDRYSSSYSRITATAIRYK